VLILHLGALLMLKRAAFLAAAYVAACSRTHAARNAKSAALALVRWWSGHCFISLVAGKPYRPVDSWPSRRALALFLPWPGITALWPIGLGGPAQHALG